jgi:hypothetical protein
MKPLFMGRHEVTQDSVALRLLRRTQRYLNFLNHKDTIPETIIEHEKELITSACIYWLGVTTGLPNDISRAEALIKEKMVEYEEATRQVREYDQKMLALPDGHPEKEEWRKLDDEVDRALTAVKSVESKSHLTLL